MPRQRTVGRHLRRIDDDLTHLDRVLPPILQRLAPPLEAEPMMLNLWQAVAQGRVRLNKPVRSQHAPEMSAWRGG